MLEPGFPNFPTWLAEKKNKTKQPADMTHDMMTQGYKTRIY